MRPTMIVICGVAWVSEVVAQQAVNLPQPQNPSQPGITSQEATPSKTAVPRDLPGAGGTTTDQPASPGVSPLEGAQPGQFGTAQDLERRAFDRRNASGQTPHPSPDQQQRIDQLNPRPGVDRSILGQPQLDRDSMERGNALGRPRTFQGDPRSAPSEAERALIIDDLRSQGLEIEDWRVVRHDGQWWVWTPEETWLVFDDRAGRWVTIEHDVRARPDVVERQSVVVFPPGYPRDEWRLVFHDGRWWFWTPNARWLYFDRGRWIALSERGNALARERQLQRERVGYRGLQQPPRPAAEPLRSHGRSPAPNTRSPQPSPAASGPTGDDRSF